MERFLQLRRKQVHPPETPASSDYATIRHASRQQERQTSRCFHCYYKQRGDNLEHSPAAEGKPIRRTSSQNLGNVTFGHLFLWLTATALFPTTVLRRNTHRLNKSRPGAKICYLRQRLRGTVWHWGPAGTTCPGWLCTPRQLPSFFFQAKHLPEHVFRR